MNVRLTRGEDIPRYKPQSEVPSGAMLVVLVAIVIFGLGTWKACELIVVVAKVWNGEAP